MLLLVFVSDLQTMPQLSNARKGYSSPLVVDLPAQEPVMSFLCFVILFGFGFLVNSENVVDN